VIDVGAGEPSKARLAIHAMSPCTDDMCLFAMS
jgi:hypothetical protein